MRRLAAAVLVAGTGLLGGVSTAHADTPGCVSRHEYDRVNKGMTMTKVHTIFDIEGDVTGLGAPNELRYYETCSGRGKVQVVYSPGGRVLSKGGSFF